MINDLEWETCFMWVLCCFEVGWVLEIWGVMFLMVSPKDKLAHRHTQRPCVVGAFWFSLVSCGCRKLEMCILVFCMFGSWCLAWGWCVDFCMFWFLVSSLLCRWFAHHYLKCKFCLFYGVCVIYPY